MLSSGAAMLWSRSYAFRHSHVYTKMVCPACWAHPLFWLGAVDEAAQWHGARENNHSNQRASINHLVRRITSICAVQLQNRNNCRRIGELQVDQIAQWGLFDR
jgi:hypothetical protein